jgi:hypothetical protein
VADDPDVLVYDTVLTDIAAIRIRTGIEGVLTRELAPLGLDAVFEDSFATLVVRVCRTRQTGTASVEVRLHDARMRIVLERYLPPPLPDVR